MREHGNEIDMQRTRELHLPGTLVVAGKGDATHFFCVPDDAGNKLRCPRCDNDSIRNQGNMKREYLDVIPKGDGIAAVTVSLRFRKSKCLSPGCGCVFCSKIPFASQYSRTTRRLEDAIVRLVLDGGYSYSQVAEIIGGTISRQAVGQIFHRRVEELKDDTSEEAKWFRQLMRDSPPTWVWYAERGHLYFDILEK